MKYTNGKKADVSAFPFSAMSSVLSAISGARGKKEEAVGNVSQVNNPIPTGGTGDIKNVIAKKVEEKVEEKVNKVVNQETSEGLV